MQRSRLKTITSDVQGEILLNLNHNDILRACKLEEFEVCNSEYFWERYAEKWGYPKIAQSWKVSVKTGPMMDGLYNFGPNYRLMHKIILNPNYKGDGFFENFTPNKESDLERLKYYKNRGYDIESSITYSKADSFNIGEPYSVGKPYNEYLKAEKIIVPYSKVILKQDSRLLEKPKYLLANEEPEDIPVNIGPRVRRSARMMANLLPSLSSRPYIKIMESFTEVLIDGDIKGSPLTVEDIFFATRAFMENEKSKIENYIPLHQDEEKIILEVKISGNPLK